MSIISNSISYFSDPKTGKPLSGVDAYVGVVDLDPQIPANRKQVTLRFETGPDLMVDQPLKIENGQFIYNNTYAIALVDGSYSFKAIRPGVGGAPDETVYYVPNNAGIFDLSQITGNQNGNVIPDMNAYIDAQTSLTYAALDAIPSALVEDGFESMVTAEGIAGPWVATTGAHTANVGSIRTFGDNAGRYWKRRFDGGASISWFESEGGATDETAIWQSIIDAGIRYAFVPYNAAGYTINTLTNSANTTFLFLGDSPMSGTQKLEGVGYVLDSGIVGGAATAAELTDKKIEVVSGTIRQQQPGPVAGITRPAGTTALVNEVDHGRAVGDWVVIQGASQTGYNGSFEIGFVDDANTYRVVVDSGLVSPATGTITVFGANVWEWIKDGTHEPVGVNDAVNVRSDGSGYGLIVYFSKTFSKVLTMNVGPDETLAGAQGMVIGSSVSVNAVAFRASLNKTVAGRVYWNGAAWAVSMGTDQGDVYTTNAPNPFGDISYSGGTLSLNHSFCLGSDIRLTPHSGGGAVVPYLPVVKTITDNGCDINFNYVNAGALDLYTGAASTNLSLHFTKNSNRLIKFDGSDRSSETKMYFGNIWFSGLMMV